MTTKKTTNLFLCALSVVAGAILFFFFPTESQFVPVTNLEIIVIRFTGIALMFFGFYFAL